MTTGIIAKLGVAAPRPPGPSHPSQVGNPSRPGEIAVLHGAPLASLSSPFAAPPARGDHRRSRPGRDSSPNMRSRARSRSRRPITSTARIAVRLRWRPLDRLVSPACPTSGPATRAAGEREGRIPWRASLVTDTSPPINLARALPRWKSPIRGPVPPNWPAPFRGALARRIPRTAGSNLVRRQPDPGGPVLTGKLDTLLSLAAGPEVHQPSQQELASLWNCRLCLTRLA